MKAKAMNSQKRSLQTFLALLIILILCQPGSSLSPIEAHNLERSEFLHTASEISAASLLEVQTPTRVQSIPEFAGVKVVHSDQNSIVLELTTPDYAFHENITASGSCTALTVPGYSGATQSGWPDLPTIGASIGLPQNAAPVLRVLEVHSQDIEGEFLVCPVPSAIIEFEADGNSNYKGVERKTNPDAYATNAHLPSEPAIIESTGYLRSQRLAQLRFHPFQYNPVTGKLTHHNLIRIEILFSTSELPISEQLSLNQVRAQSYPEPASFESILASTVLNYDLAQEWRTPPQPERPLTSTPQGTLQPRYKIHIRESGIYTLTYETLTSLGADLSYVDPRNIHMTNQGHEIAIQVIGEDDGVFDKEDFILFYGEGIDTKFTDTNIYWLYWDQTAGLRMDTISGIPAQSSPISTHFLTTQHLEQNANYLYDSPNSQGDTWYGDMAMLGVASDYVFELDAIHPISAMIAVRGEYLGYSAIPGPQNHIDTYLNGHHIHSGAWSPEETLQFAASIPQDFLQQGTNVLSATIPTSSNTSEFVFTNWYEVDYHRNYVAHDDIARFSVDEPGEWTYVVDGFSDSDIYIYDITDPWQPGEVMDFQIDGGYPAYTVTMSLDSTPESAYLALPSTSWRSPFSIERDKSSDLTAASNGADYIIISHSSLITAAHTLADYRAASGLRTMAVDVQDVYDEFSYGIFDPAAIQSFLAHTYVYWEHPAPSYIVLLGDGNYDFRNYIPTRPESTYIPPYMADVDPWMRETAADNRYVCVSGSDTLPDMHLGRLAVKTLSEAQSLVAKLVSYEENPGMEDWRSTVLFVADNADDAGLFDVSAEEIATQHLPLPYSADRVYYGVTHDKPSAQAAIKTRINAGTLLVNYIGHGSVQLWADEKLLEIATIAQLTNANKYPFFVPMTCLDGRYTVPSSTTRDSSSLAEAIVRAPNKGAIASWSPTGLGLASGHDYLNRALFDAIFKEDIIELGPATTYAKLYLYANSGGQHLDLLDTYLLFGDPATRLNVLPVDVQIAKEVVGHAEPYETGETLTYRLTYTNTGPATAHHVTISDTLPGVLRNLAVVSSGTPVTPQVGSAFVWDVADLPAGAGGVITVTGEIGPYSGALINMAAIATTSRETETLSNRAAVTTTVIAPDLVITKSVSAPEPLRPGNEIAYTLTFQNTGDATAREVVIEDRLSAAHEYVSYTATGAPLVARPGTQYIWDAGDLTPGAGGTITVHATIDTAVTGFITNTATITTSSIESDAVNNTGQTAIYVLAPDLAISKHVAPSAFLHPGDPITYTLVFTNAGSELAHQVVITDSVPPQVLDITVVSSSVPITQRSSSAYVWDTVDLAPGASGAITLTGILDFQYEGGVTNRAEIGAGTPEYHLANNAGEATVSVALLFTDLSISQRLTPGSVLRSLQPVTYTILFTNTGPGIARRVVITDALPAALQSPNAASSGAPIALRPGSRYVWDVADMGPTTGGIITITGILSPTVTGYPLTNTVTIRTASVETTTLNNTAVLTVHVAPHRLYLPIVPHGHVPSQAMASWADRDR